MIDLYLSSSTDRGTWLRKSLEGSLPCLKVSGSVLTGNTPVEMAHFQGDVAALQERMRAERYRSEIDYDEVLRGHLGRK